MGTSGGDQVFPEDNRREGGRLLNPWRLNGGLLFYPRERPSIPGGF